METSLRSKQDQVQRKHDEVMAMQDAIYQKVQKKRSELDQLTRDLGQTAATLRDHDALVKERMAQSHSLIDSVKRMEAREVELRQVIERRQRELREWEDTLARQQAEHEERVREWERRRSLRRDNEAQTEWTYDSLERRESQLENGRETLARDIAQWVLAQ